MITLTANWSNALTALKQQDSLQKELLDLDTSTEAGQMRRDKIQQSITQLCHTTDKCLKECGFIYRMLEEDPKLSIQSITEERLFKAIGKTERISK